MIQQSIHVVLSLLALMAAVFQLQDTTQVVVDCFEFGRDDRLNGNIYDQLERKRVSKTSNNDSDHSGMDTIQSNGEVEHASDATPTLSDFMAER